MGFHLQPWGVSKAQAKHLHSISNEDRCMHAFGNKGDEQAWPSMWMLQNEAKRLQCQQSVQLLCQQSVQLLSQQCPTALPISQVLHVHACSARRGLLVQYQCGGACACGVSETLHQAPQVHTLTMC